MSFYTLNPTDHDMNTALAILDTKKNYPGMSLVAADGGFPFQDLIAPDSPTILGYKPDAICSDELSVRIIEAKSIEDLKSGHSKSQFLIMKKILYSVENCFLDIYVFGEGSLPSNYLDHLSNLPARAFTLRRFNGGAILEHKKI